MQTSRLPVVIGGKETAVIATEICGCIETQCACPCCRTTETKVFQLPLKEACERAIESLTRHFRAKHANSYANSETRDELCGFS